MLITAAGETNRWVIVKMRLTLYKMTPQGMIATANMLLCGIVLLAPAHLLPVAKGWLYAILRMPLIFLCPVHTGPPEMADVVGAPLLIIANAYLWGYALVWLGQRTMKHFRPEKPTPNQGLHATSEAAPGADSSAPQG